MSWGVSRTLTKEQYSWHSSGCCPHRSHRRRSTMCGAIQRSFPCLRRLNASPHALIIRVCRSRFCGSSPLRFLFFVLECGITSRQTKIDSLSRDRLDYAHPRLRPQALTACDYAQILKESLPAPGSGVYLLGSRSKPEPHAGLLPIETTNGYYILVKLAALKSSGQSAVLISSFRLYDGCSTPQLGCKQDLVLPKLVSIVSGNGYGCFPMAA